MMRKLLAKTGRLLCRLAEAGKADGEPSWEDVILDTVRPYTMVHESGVRFAIEQTVSLIEAEVPGVIVECGVWRGGCSMAMLLAQRARYGRVLKPVHLFDSFEGLPEAKTRDGSLALEWQKGETETFFDNCSADEQQVRDKLCELGFVEGEDFHIHRGWFDDSLPRAVPGLRDQQIALLRLDGDWYESTLVCLQQLEPLTAIDGIVIVDDYYTWDGCARAVHDYLSQVDMPYRIKSLPYHFAAYFTKLPARRSLEEF